MNASPQPPSGAPCSIPELVAALSGASDAGFHGALGQLGAVPDLAGTGGVRLVIDVVGSLAARSELGARAQADRVHAILRVAALRDSALSDLASQAGAFPPGIRNAVANVMPPAYRRIVVSRAQGAAVGAVAVSTASPAATPRGTGGATGNPPGPPQPRERAFSTVVLLAGPMQEANKHLLEGSDFAPIVLTSLERLQQDLESSTDVCGCLIDGSVLQVLDHGEQKRLFELLGAYSTFLWIRIDESHLKLTRPEVRLCLRTVRCLPEDVPSALLSIQPDGTLRQQELPDIRAASATLQAYDEADHVPGNLSANEANVLMAAAKLYARELCVDGDAELTSLETEFLQGARSGARVALLRVNRSGRPIIAKIASKKNILDEMTRFRTFIGPWDSELRPRLHFHGDVAVLLFGLVSDVADGTRPAEVLFGRLEDLWNAQLFAKVATPGLAAQCEALAEGVELTARRLRELNARRPPDSDLRAPNPDLSVFDNQSGLDWGLSAIARTAFEKARTRFSRFAFAATVHGDVHLRNVLLRADRDPHLIDYAGSGPGHPAADLARFELALFLGMFRQFESEARCVDYQRSLTLDGASYAALKERFPVVHQCLLNVVCTRGCVAARDHALALVTEYGGDAADYYAAKYLIAWQSLAVTGTHTGLARATIDALAERVALV